VEEDLLSRQDTARLDLVWQGVMWQPYDVIASTVESVPVNTAIIYFMSKIKTIDEIDEIFRPHFLT
jgi:hypothetical protein